MPSTLDNKPYEQQHSELESDPNAAASKLPSKHFRVADSAAKQLQDSISMDSKSQSHRGLKKKVELMQSHIQQLEERQKKLESHEAKM